MNVVVVDDLETSVILDVVTLDKELQQLPMLHKQ